MQMKYKSNEQILKIYRMFRMWCHRDVEDKLYFLNNASNKFYYSSISTNNQQLKETSEHYILHCPRFTRVRQNTIFRLPANLLNITTLLQGDPNISNNMNSLIFKAVQDFIVQSSCFAMEWQTQLNSYWQRIRAFSLFLSLSWLLLLFSCCLI